MKNEIDSLLGKEVTITFDGSFFKTWLMGELSESNSGYLVIAEYGDYAWFHESQVSKVDMTTKTIHISTIEP